MPVACLGNSSLVTAIAAGVFTRHQSLESLLESGGSLSFAQVQMIVENWSAAPRPTTQLHIETVDLKTYDGLLTDKEAM